MKIILTLGALALVGCGDNTKVQTISGRVSAPTFGEQVETVAVHHRGAAISSVPVAADGSFTVYVPRGTRYSLHFATASERVGLVAPRATGTFDMTFDVAGSGAPFDIGMVRRVNQPLGMSYHYGTAGDDSDDTECEDGLDPNGAVCVDEEDGQSCQADDGDDNGSDEGEAEDDGESNDDGDANEDGETDVAEAAAIAEHTLPSTMGCDGEADHDNDGEEEGDH